MLFLGPSFWGYVPTELWDIVDLDAFGCFFPSRSVGHMSSDDVWPMRYVDNIWAWMPFSPS